MLSEPDAYWPVLIVEDDLPTAELELRVLQRSGRTARVVHGAAAALEALGRERFSVVLLDYMLIGENGWSVLETAKAMRPAVPVIVVTGRGSEAVAVEALRLGAVDYLIKNGEFWEQLPNIIERVVTIRRAEHLRDSLATVADSSGDAIVGMLASGAIASWNSGAERLFGYAAAAAQNRPIADMFPLEQREVIERTLEKVNQGERPGEFEVEGLSSNHAVLKLSVLFSPIKRDKDGTPCIAMVARDISDRKLAEAQLRRSEYQLLQIQKFEAIRDLSGGVAHEFNNLLTVMIVGCEKMKGKLAPEHPIWRDLDVVIQTGERAALVSRNLQSFSRQQQLRPTFFILNTSLLAIHGVLNCLTGEAISIDLKLAPDLAQIYADPVKFDEVVVNLVKNSFDAMPSGGKITIETSNVLRDEEFARAHRPFKAGEYVLLTVSDTGCGMEEATRARVFEPFFTTKGRARRSGLGLAMVYGTVKQSDGFIYALGEPKKGARFELYFPLVASSGAAPATCAPVVHSEPAGKTILVVDDERMLLELVSEILVGCGYTVIGADSPSEALALAAAHTGTIDLLLTDVIMPEMQGPELSRQLCALRPALRVLYMSGHPEKYLENSGNAVIDFIPKPFSVQHLKSKVQEALDRS